MIKKLILKTMTSTGALRRECFEWWILIKMIVVTLRQVSFILNDNLNPRSIHTWKTNKPEVQLILAPPKYRVSNHQENPFSQTDVNDWPKFRPEQIIPTYCRVQCAGVRIRDETFCKKSLCDPLTNEKQRQALGIAPYVLWIKIKRISFFPFCLKWTYF